MNNIIKISIVVTLALIIALFAGCGKKKTENPKNESSILMGGDIEDILGKDDAVTSDIGMGELLPDEDEDTVDAGALDDLENPSSTDSGNNSKDNNSKDNASKDNNSSKNQSSSSSKNESSSKTQSSSSKNESSSKTQSSSKNESSSSKNPSSSQTSSSTTSSETQKDNESKVYTPGWI